MSGGANLTWVYKHNVGPFNRTVYTLSYDDFELGRLESVFTDSDMWRILIAEQSHGRVLGLDAAKSTLIQQATERLLHIIKVPIERWNNG